MNTSLSTNPYLVLGVSAHSKFPEIRTAHRKLVLKHHPDKVQDPALKAAKRDEFFRIQQAYEILSDDSKRQRYDDEVKLSGLKKLMGRENPTPGSSPFEYEVTEAQPRQGKHTSDYSSRKREFHTSRLRAQYSSSSESEPPPAYARKIGPRMENVSKKSSAVKRKQKADSFAPKRDDKYVENRRPARRAAADDDRWEEHRDLAARYMQKSRETQAKSGQGNTTQSPTSSKRFGGESFSVSDKPKLQRTTSSEDMNQSIRQMHHSMGSDYGDSEEEEGYRSRRTNRSRSTSRNRRRSLSRNRAHIEAYASTKHSRFLDVSEILSRNSVKLSPAGDGGPSRSNTFEGRRVHPTRSSKCFCCLAQLNTSNIVSLSCKHLWCISCLSTSVRLALVSAELWPPKCCSIQISAVTLETCLDEVTKERYLFRKKRLQELKCPSCPESFSDMRLILRHYKDEHLDPKVPTLSDITISRDDMIDPSIQATSTQDVDSDDSKPSTPSSVSEVCTPSTTITEPDPEAESLKSESLPSSTPSRSTPKPTLESNHGTWKILGLPRKFVSFLGKAIIHCLSLQTTAWFILVLAAVATSITTTYSLQDPPPSPPPQVGDNNYYSLLSQSIIAICSLYYLMVPYLRGDEDLPVRALFYICWTLGLAGAITAPLIYAQEWSKSVWAGFSSNLAQLAATAFLFEHVGKSEQKQGKEKSTKAETGESDEVEKYTDSANDDTEET